MREQCNGGEQGVGQRVLLAADAYPELFERAQADSRRFLGGIALRGASEGQIERPESETVGKDTLLEATQLASLGDEASRAVVRTNVMTDVLERCFKAAHQTKIQMRMQAGKLMQNGRSLENVNRNALEQTVLNDEMLRRAKHELRNVMLFQELHKAGVLEHYNAVVWSPTPTAMTTQEKKRYGFFLDTESCSIQMLSAEGDGVTLESAFVAGKQSAAAERHDIDAIHMVAAECGVMLGTTDGTDMVGQVMLVPKTMAPTVQRVVQLYDEALGGTFYGQDKPRQDYDVHAAECQQRSDDFDDIIEVIIAQLVEEAHTFKTPMDAIMRLDELSERHCVRKAGMDATINKAVFGEQSAMHIAEMRFFIERGDIARAEQSYSKAVETADSSSCPFVKDKKSDSTGGGGGGGSAGGDGESGASAKKEDKSEKTKMKCPFCKWTVYDDPCAEKLSCTECVANVNRKTVTFEGNGGRKERRRVQAEIENTLIADIAKAIAQKNKNRLTPAPLQQPAVAAGALALARAK